jgi:hypothetical protein
MCILFDYGPFLFSLLTVLNIILKPGTFVIISFLKVQLRMFYSQCLFMSMECLFISYYFHEIEG